MPKFTVTGPDGSTYSVNGPEGSTESDAISYVKRTFSPPPEKNPSELRLTDVPGQALQNLGPSAEEFGKSIVQPFIHPVQTAENIGKLGLGVSQKLGLGPSVGTDYTPYADAVGQFFKERYGGYENLKRTIANDPVGFAADIATVASGGETALARLPGVAGKVGEVSGQVAKYTNPLNVTKLAPVAGKVASEVGGVVTGKGAEAISGAARTAFKGGQGQEEFFKNLRDPKGNQEAVVQRAKKALSEVWMERSAAYQRDMAPISNDPAILKFDDIDSAINKAHAVKQFRGRDVSALVGANEKLPADIVKEKLENAVASWRQLPAAQYHTPAGFDALKQYVGDVKDHYQYGTPEWKVANDIYSSIRNTIVKQSPDYARVMKDYQEATDKLNEITKTLSLGKKASEDTALRKLLSTTRSDVNANFGRRLSLVEELNKIDPSILPSLYGQALSPYAPGGLMRGAAGAGGLAALAEGGKAALLNPKIIAALLATSPRLWGELAAKMGQGARKTRELTPQQIIDAANKLNPDMLKQLGLGSRVIGGAGVTQ